MGYYWTAVVQYLTFLFHRVSPQLGIFSALFLLLIHGSAWCQMDISEEAVRFCSKQSNSIALSENRDILCFDGPIKKETDLTAFNSLNFGGRLAIRSSGGHIITAMRIADILMERNATVVIYDYCLSACANAIFVASHRTHVVGEAIVAWHRGIPRLHCGGARTPRTRIDAVEAQTQSMYSHDDYCDNIELLNNFYRRRNIDSNFTYRPQTRASRQIFQLIMREAADKNRIFWMWNPANFGNHFKTEIEFQRYPDSQHTVDSLVRRSKLPIRVVYDPRS